MVEADLKLEDVYSADEAFYVGTAAEVTSIESLDDHKIGESQELTKKIKE